MRLYIKNMVCNRCKMVVKVGLEKLGLHPVSVELGEVELDREPDEETKNNIRLALNDMGFDLVDDRKSQLIEKVKSTVVELVYAKNSEQKTNLSDYITRHIPHTYNHISSLFTEVEGTTIEQYFIAQKIERVKELLVYGELTITEIAFQSGYSSVAHLSGQFKKVTGLNPSHFRGIREVKQKPPDQL